MPFVFIARQLTWNEIRSSPFPSWFHLLAKTTVQWGRWLFHTDKFQLSTMCRTWHPTTELWTDVPRTRNPTSWNNFTEHYVFLPSSESRFIAPTDMREVNWHVTSPFIHQNHNNLRNNEGHLLMITRQNPQKLAMHMRECKMADNVVNAV